ncbi:MAG: M48 family metallopeptidase [Lachnospiraceae bacterium]|nr:M48 family metallopeptidase [Lachnospiraceae bacterium]
MQYRIIRSNRRTIAIQVTREGVIVRAPRRMTDDEIQYYIEKNQDWLRAHIRKMEDSLKKSQVPADRLTTDEVRALAEQAVRIIPERVGHYAPLVGVTYGKITIRNQKTRWGSCSAKGNLNFNCLLMLTPPEVIDSVVVHELCHRKVMNHSRAFYQEVYRVYPEYDRWDRWLKENGNALMMRMFG